MTYYLNLFSPETYQVFTDSDRKVSGFRLGQRTSASRINKGDRFICYMTKLSRWIGVLEIISEVYEDDTPIYYAENDPFVLRFKVRPIAWLDYETAIPIREDFIWDKLSFTKGIDRGGSHWTGKLRSSLTPLNDQDGQFLEQVICDQVENGHRFPISDDQYNKLVGHTVTRPDKVVTVSVPQDSDEDISTQSAKEVRESTKIQALLAKIGHEIGMSIWIPASDRNRVLAELGSGEWNLVDSLPLSYDKTTLDTIKEIDILWLKGRAIRRAFEVEHTTSIYSGILRMADLLALQPNMDIRLHIVAPISRRDKVMQEIKRPVFSLLEKGPLYESCTFLSYDSVHEVSNLKHLDHMRDDILNSYEETAVEE